METSENAGPPMTVRKAPLAAFSDTYSWASSQKQNRAGQLAAAMSSCLIPTPVVVIVVKIEIGDLNTSKAKLRGAKYQREKTKTGWFS